ncbi:mitochondrial potassium channel isoform X1 [Brachyistius frenatus]|uniref:mitochondrial potassium channel isoform X1 n=1 Tax=Brachyistius frenatus TaxID=100188 RepID=UPI0037E7F663
MMNKRLPSVRYRGPQVFLWCRLSRPPVRTYTAQRQAAPPPAAAPSGPDRKRAPELVKERVLAAVQLAGEVGRQWGQRSAQTAGATVGYWWEKYEEFVGLNEVREAQTNVTEAEAAFMVARGIVREAHVGLAALEVRLKEVRDRLDRVSREEAHYLELATMEHKLLQEERRLRTAYENAEGSEREKFALFSAAVRGSHEKERTRAERTKNWSVIGSVLGALIGVMGSTYVNRVRLQQRGDRLGLNFSPRLSSAGAEVFAAGGPERSGESSGGPDRPGGEPPLPAGRAASAHRQPPGRSERRWRSSGRTRPGAGSGPARRVSFGLEGPPRRQPEGRVPPGVAAAAAGPAGGRTREGGGRVGNGEEAAGRRAATAGGTAGREPGHRRPVGVGGGGEASGGNPEDAGRRNQDKHHLQRCVYLHGRRHHRLRRLPAAQRSRLDDGLNQDRNVPNIYQHICFSNLPAPGVALGSSTSKYF